MGTTVSLAYEGNSVIYSMGDFGFMMLGLDRPSAPLQAVILVTVAACLF